MSNDPLVSVIIPVYNTEKYVETAVLSVLNQSYTNIEIIIVVDGSPDNAYCVCNEFAKKYEKIKLLHHELNLGLSAARNTGLGVSTGKYIFFLDSDDFALPDAIRDMVRIIEKEKSDAVFPKKYIRTYMGDTAEYVKSYFESSCCTEDPVIFGAEVIIEKCCAWGTTALLYRRSVIESNSLLFTVGITAEDIVFNLDFLKKAKKISFYDMAAESKLKRRNSITGSYRDNFKENLLYIYNSCIAFLTETGFSKEDTDIKSAALLCRSVTAHIVNIMSDKNPTKGYFNKASMVKDFLNDNKIKKVFRNKTETPYFTKKVHKTFLE